MIPAVSHVELVGGPLDGELYAITVNELGVEIAFPLQPAHLKLATLGDLPIIPRSANYLVTERGVATY